MLQFILGRASSGKTYTVTQKIAQCISQGESPVLLVPEQFSFESEKNILNVVGDGEAQKVAVISFTRLCDEIERVAGGICGQSVSQADKIILMNKALKNCRDELKRFKRYSNSASFARVMIDTITEFKLQFVMPEDIYSVAEKTTDELFKRKLFDTALIYENYNAVMSEKFIDDTDRITKLYYALEKHRFFENKTVFIDSFQGFSGQQYKIIERILSQAKDVFVTLADNPLDNRALGLFANVKKVKDHIIKIAKTFAVKIDEDIILADKNYANEDLCALEEFMANGKTNFDLECPSITICRADSIYNEADFVARNIRRIVREQGARYSDFVIIARDTANYEDALLVATQKNNISCFIDRRIPLKEMPTSTAIIAAANVAQKATTENILRFYKSGIDVLSDDEISTLENYTFLWNIEGAIWENEWTMDPTGFNAKKELNQSAIDELARINKIRKKAIDPLLALRKDFKGDAAQMARALVNLFENCDAAKRFYILSKKFNDGEGYYSDAIKQSWDSVMKILNSLVVCFGNSPISKKEFCDALELSLSLETVGVIPQMIDEATFGAADRIRPSRPKYAFIIGANQGVFPKTEHSKGLFVGSERQLLIDNGIKIPDTTFSQAIDEEHLLYRNLCCASHGVFISYSATIDGNTPAEPSAFVEEIKENFNCNNVVEPSPLSENSLPETFEDAFSQLCINMSEQSGPDVKTLVSAISDSEISDRVDGVLKIQQKPQFFISEGAAKSLFGDTISMSPSRFDTFNRCRFMYFCRYGLKAERLQPAEFNAMQRGTIVHYVLQRVVEDYGKAISSFDDCKISEVVDGYIDEYLSMIAGYADIETPYLKFLVFTIKRSLKYVVARLAAEFGQSDFEPVKCELAIRSEDGDIPQIKIPIDDYGSLELNGVVDRLDKWNGYIRIVDYKTGHRDFKLPDILFGQNMQMLIYLYAVTKSEEFGGLPAGILYMPANREKKGVKSDRRMNGLLAADELIITAMEKQNSGEFVPKYSEKSPSDSFINPEDFNKIFDFIERKLKSTGKSIFCGDIAADPVDGLDSGACKYCEYQNICRMANEKHKSVPKLSNSEVLSEMERQVSNDGI